MIRRGFLAVMALSLSGCASKNEPVVEKIQVVQKELSTSKSTCSSDPEHSATVSFVDRSSVSVSGSLATENVGRSLSASVFTSVNPRSSEEVILEVSTNPKEETGERCRGTIEYTVETKLSRMPNRVRVQHATDGDIVSVVTVPGE
jgi:hypothetical protein